MARLEPWHRNLAALWVAQTLTMIAFSFVFPFFPLYVQELGVSGVTEAAQWASFITAAAAISMAIVQPFWGNLADRHGRRPMVIRSMLGASFAVMLMGFVTSPEQLFFVRLLQGALSGTVAAANALVATSAPKNRTGFALGAMQMAMFLGGSIGPLLGGLIADGLGFRTTFYVAAAMMLAGAIIVIALVKEDFVKPEAKERPAGALAQSRALLGISFFPILLGVTFMIQFGGVIVQPVLSLFVHEINSGVNAATASGIIMGATGAVSAIAALVLGRLSDRIGHSVILPICLIGAAIVYMPQTFVTDFGQLFILRALLGIFLGGLMPSANALITRVVPHAQRGAAFGLAATSASLAAATGPMMAALIVTFSDIRAIFFVTAVCYVITLGLVVIGFRRHKPVLAASQEPIKIQSSAG